MRSWSREFGGLIQEPQHAAPAVWLSTVWIAELLVEAGDPRLTTAVGFAPFSGTAPLTRSTVEGVGGPLRHHQNLN